MSLVILLDTPSKREATKILNKRPSKIICKNAGDLPDILRNVSIVEYNLDPKSIKKITSQCFDDVLGFGHESIEKKKIIDWLTINNHSLWFNIRMILYNHYKKDVVDLEYVKASLSYLESGQKFWVFPIIDLNVLSDESKPNFLGGIKKTVSFRPLRAKMKYLLLFSLRSCLGLIQLLKRSKKGKYNVIITHPLYRQSIFSNRHQKLINGDPHIENLLEHVIDDPNFLFLSEGHPPRLDDPSRFRINYDSVFYHNRKSVSLEAFMTKAIFSRGYKLDKIELTKSIESLQKGVRSEQNTSNHLLISNLIKLKPLIGFILLYRSAAKILFEHFKIETITTTNEHGSNNRAVLNVAKSLGIKTIGVQHGAVYPDHIEYYFSENDMDYTPIPDYTITWGNRWNQVLSEASNYPQSSLIPLGQLRTDWIYNLTKDNNSKKSKDHRPTVLFASQPLFQGEEMIREKYASDFLKLSKEFPEAQFIIKPHPREADYKEYFTGLANQIDTSNFEFFTGDLYEILSVTDVAIVYYSTVGDEAIYFDIPLLVFDYYHQDFAEYVKNGVGLGCHDFLELSENLKLAISEPSTLTKSYDGYKNNNVFEIDGNTANRYCEFIKEAKN